MTRMSVLDQLRDLRCYYRDAKAGWEKSLEAESSAQPQNKSSIMSCLR